MINGGEDRNRTYLATRVATTVLKTARATRHPSLSGWQIETRSLPSLARRCPSRLCLLSRRSFASAVDCGLVIEFFAREARFGVRRLDAAFEQSRSEKLQESKQSADYFAFLTALTISSKSGHSPDSSLEWSSLPLARISKAPPLDGISVSDLMRSPSSRILAAKLTAFGV
jgi:hypothetical protein